uniref:Pleiomorphic adenoma protein-like 2 protein n=1 Tax=Globodera pallida TaxID=36090 RepID=A0A183CRN7_GLOPA
MGPSPTLTPEMANPGLSDPDPK